MSHINRSPLRALTLGGFLAFVAAPPPAQATPLIYNLGTLGGSQSYGYAINASGQITGYGRIASDTADHAYIYTGIPGSGGAMADLGTLGGHDSIAYAINATGQVAGQSDMTGNGNRAFLYSGGAMADLGTLGGTFSYAYGINNTAQVVGFSYIRDGSQHAFLYSGTPGSGGAMVDLGTLGTLGGTNSRANAINNAGQIAGESYIGINSGGNHAFLYTGTPGSGGAMVDLGTLGGLDSFANGINDSGQIVGGSNPSQSADDHAFLYSGVPGAGGQMIDLDTLGGTNSYAIGINSAGDVVGSSDTTANAATHAFLYVGKPGIDGHMVDLDAWLDANDPADGANWTLGVATCINDSGLITGYATYNDGSGGLSDGTRAFLLDASSLVPEPSSLSLLALAGLSMVCRRRLGCAGR